MYTLYRMFQEERSIFWEVIVSKQKSVYVHVSYSERFPRYSYFTVQYIVHCTEQHAMSSHELQSGLTLTVEFLKMYYTVLGKLYQLCHLNKKCRY
jgi:hypothetical protein